MISDSMVQQATTLYLEPQPKAKSLDMRQLMSITTTAKHDKLQCALMRLSTCSYF